MSGSFEHDALARVREARERARTALVEPPAPTPAPPGRAGRNLPLAIGVGIGLIALVVASLAWRREAFLVLLIVASLLGCVEVTRAVRSRSLEVPLLPLGVGAVGMLVSAWFGGPGPLVVALVLTAGTLFVWRLLDGGGPGAARDACAGVFAAAYVPFLLSFAAMMAHHERGFAMVIAFMLMVVANDTGGYIAGVLFGAHAMAPTISPKKSWEGFAGSLVLAIAVAFAMVVGVLGAPWWAAPLTGVLVVLAATVGDLAESLLKRDLGLKDFGNLLPGHGGIMERLDSMAVAAPVGYLILFALVPQ